MSTFAILAQKAGKALALDAVRAWFQPIPAPVETVSRMAEAAGTTIDADEALFRPLTSQAERNLSPIKQEHMQKMAYYLWESNLLANRLIELPVAYLLAQGVKLTVKDDENQKVLDRFWRDPINEMDLKLPKKVRELSLYGEQCYPVFVREGSGAVRLGSLDPANINTVVMDPDNPEQPIGVVTKKDRKDRAHKYRVIVNGADEDCFTERTCGIRATDFPDGECFFFKINDLSNGSRGRSDLLAQIDWLDAYDQYLFGELDRAKFLRAFMWDVELVGATPEQVKARAKEITAPAANSVRVHNDAEKWKTESPTINAADTSEQARLIRNHILGGSTTPEHWFGGGGDVNRATAGEMGEPTFKMYSMRQNFLKSMLESMGRYALLQSAKVASASVEIDWSDPAYDVHAEFPEMVSKDVAKYTAALAQTAVAAAALVNAKLITMATAGKMVSRISAELGIEFDAEAEIKAALVEAGNAARSRAEDDAKLPPLPEADGLPAIEPAAAKAS